MQRGPTSILSHLGRGDPRFATVIDPSTTPGCAACDESLSKDVRIDDWSAMMARAQAGDQAAYAALLEAITPYLRSLATAHCRRREDVEDAVQDILLTVHEIRHTYDPRRPVGPWLAAIARRRIADHLRQRYRRTIREAELAPRPKPFGEMKRTITRRKAMPVPCAKPLRSCQAHSAGRSR
jgi:hypothetical protein